MNSKQASCRFLSSVGKLSRAEGSISEDHDYHATSVLVSVCSRSLKGQARMTHSTEHSAATIVGIVPVRGENRRTDDRLRTFRSTDRVSSAPSSAHSRQERARSRLESLFHLRSCRARCRSTRRGRGRWWRGDELVSWDVGRWDFESGIRIALSNLLAHGALIELEVIERTRSGVRDKDK